MHITICGGGNAAHTAAGWLASRSDLDVRIYLSDAGEARQWQAGLAAQGGIQVLHPGGALVGRPGRASADPGEALPGSQIVLLALPAFAHEAVLAEIAPHLDPGAWVGAMPARSCFDLCARQVLGDRLDSLTLFGLQTLPWACRIQRYGQQVSVLGTKSQVDLAAWPGEQAQHVAARLSDLLGIPVQPVANFLSLTLAGTGQLIHPGIMYGLFRHWDGAPLAEAPLFYQGVDASTAQVLRAMSDEIQELRSTLEARFPGLDLSAVRPLAEWLLVSYRQDILDSSTLQSCLNTNRSYAGLRAPVRAVPGGFEPDFQARYLSEDVPYSLLATLGIAELAGLAAPVITQVIQWSQARLGKRYLVDGALRGRDLAHSRAPQRYGYETIDQLVENMALWA